MRYGGVLVLLLVSQAGCAPVAGEISVESTPGPLGLASEIEFEQERASPALGVQNQIEEGATEILFDVDKFETEMAETAAESDIIGPSGSLNLKDIAAKDQAVDGMENGLVIQPAPVAAGDRRSMKRQAVQKLADRLGIDLSNVNLISLDEVD